MKKKIAVIISELRFEGQTLTVRGLLDVCGNHECEVFIFTCDSSWSGMHGGGAALPLFNAADYDGIIFHGDTITNEQIKKELLREIAGSGVPAVSVKDPHEGLALAGMDNRSGIRDIVFHLKNVHGASVFNFVSGVPGNFDAEERLAAFRSACADCGIEIDEDRIDAGWFSPRGGRDAFRRWYEKRDELPLPDAIVCASDWMAVGVIEEAAKCGIKVPDDLKVTGFDDTAMSRISDPSITTVSLPNYDIGRLAAERLIEFIETGTMSGRDQIENPAIFRESCGCHSPESAENERTRELKKYYFNESLNKRDYLGILRSIQMEFAGARDWDEFYHIVADSARVFKAAAFFLCTTLPHQSKSSALAEILDENEDNLMYTGEVKVPVALIDGCGQTFEPFAEAELMSGQMRSAADGRYYVILPLHYRSRKFGYCIVCNSEIAYESEFYSLYIQTISSAMENLWVKSRLSTMINILDELWEYDKLTGVMNRSGFYRYAPKLIEEAKTEGASLFVLFADLDGMKTVNDTLGHDVGDSYIVKAAEILRSLHTKGELMMRYGGDEFIVLAKGYTSADADLYRERVARAAEAADKAEQAFEISLSTGYSLHMPEDGLTLEEMIEEADARMMKHKHARKKSR